MASNRKITYAVGDKVHVTDSEIDAVILDRMVSQITGKVAYTLESEDLDGDWSDTLFDPEELEPVILGDEQKNLDIRFECAENLVTARLYRDGKQICYGHGHIFHEGIIGYVQAASYAVKRVYQQIAELDKQE